MIPISILLFQKSDYETWMIGKISMKHQLKNPVKKESITGADYTHGKKVCRDFEIQILGEYHF